MGLGVFDMVSGAKRGGVGGTEQALGGAVGFTGGAATTLAPGPGAAAAPVALGATAFNAGMALGNAGLKESPYDLPGTAADWGESAHDYVADSWAGNIPGASSVAGAAATLGGQRRHGARSGLLRRQERRQERRPVRREGRQRDRGRSDGRVGLGVR